MGGVEAKEMKHCGRPGCNQTFWNEWTKSCYYHGESNVLKKRKGVRNDEVFLFYWFEILILRLKILKL
jgi:hypothetical protein